MANRFRVRMFHKRMKGRVTSREIADELQIHPSTVRGIAKTLGLTLLRDPV